MNNRQREARYTTKSHALFPFINTEQYFYEVIEFLRDFVNKNKIKQNIRKQFIYIIDNCDNREKVSYSKVSNFIQKNYELIYGKRRDVEISRAYRSMGKPQDKVCIVDTKTILPVS
jgi:uncharacterized protein YeeX (DUF496 family)